MEECEERGVLVFDAGGLVRNEDELAWGIKAVVAAVERKKIARRVRDNLQQLKQQGRVLGHAPLGYRVSGKNATRHLEVDTHAGPIVRRIFELYATGGFSIERLARRLNDGATPLPQNPDYPKPAHRWSANLLKGMLVNPTYIGKVRGGAELRDGGIRRSSMRKPSPLCRPCASRTASERPSTASVFIPTLSPAC
jgi:DNA invertase Pin-like site-specific DNA recombinase